MPTRGKAEIHPREILRALHDTGRFNATKLGDLERPEIWAALLSLWNSKRCAVFRDAWDLGGFALFICEDIGRRRFVYANPDMRVRFYRLQRLHKRAGTAGPRKMKRAADRNDATTKAIAALSVSPMWSPAGDVPRFALDASIVLGDLLLAKTDAVMFSFKDEHETENNVCIARSKMLDISRALRGRDDVWCFFMPGPYPMLSFRWKDGRAGLNFHFEWPPGDSFTVVPFAATVAAAPVEPADEIAHEIVEEEQPAAVAEPAETAQEEPAPQSTVRPKRRACPVCEHTDRATLDRALANGAAPSALLMPIGVDGYTARVHARDHLTTAMATARRAAVAARRAA